ncbi:MAG: hypothetical protein LBC61_01540 [Candidatus Peribacteria bacterium]|jgi:hypothetical protein|nr:hypothetical protein [Candidatus Peribacteria bacterium]
MQEGSEGTNGGNNFYELAFSVGDIRVRFLRNKDGKEFVIYNGYSYTDPVKIEEIKNLPEIKESLDIIREVEAIRSIREFINGILENSEPYGVLDIRRFVNDILKKHGPILQALVIARFIDKVIKNPKSSYEIPRIKKFVDRVTQRPEPKPKQLEPNPALDAILFGTKFNPKPDTQA